MYKRQTSDGFAVAQFDLETRGPGDFFGSRQHGLPTLQIADLMNDTRTLHAVSYTHLDVYKRQARRWAYAPAP